MAGEKRKARGSINEKSTKREKKSNTSVISTASNEEVDEQTSMHSNGSTTESNEQIQENVDVQDEIQTSPSIATINVEEANEENNVQTEETSSVDDACHPINKENRTATKSWWSSLTRFFHFGYGSGESKTSLDSNDNDLQSPSYLDGSYLSNVKSRRNLHDESLVG